MKLIEVLRVLLLLLLLFFFNDYITYISHVNIRGIFPSIFQSFLSDVLRM